VSVQLLETFCPPRRLKIKFHTVRREEKITDLITKVRLLSNFSA